MRETEKRERSVLLSSSFSGVPTSQLLAHEHSVSWPQMQVEHSSCITCDTGGT